MSDVQHSGAVGPSQRGMEAGAAITMALFGVVVIIGSLQVGVGWGAEGPKSGFFPFYVGLAILASSLINLAASRRFERSKRFASWVELGQVGQVVWPTAIYVGLAPYGGIYVPSVLLIAYFMRKMGSYRPSFCVAVAVAVMAALYLVFETWFLVPLPKGPIEELIGL